MDIQVGFDLDEIYFTRQRNLACPLVRLNYLVASNIEFSRGRERGHHRHGVVLGPQT